VKNTRFILFLVFYIVVALVAGFVITLLFLPTDERTPWLTELPPANETQQQTEPLPQAETLPQVSTPPLAETSRLEGAPLLDVPVACVMGAECFVQNYFDQDPGPGVLDYGCGARTYDGHRGTDIRTRTLAEMWAGVGVVAAAPGTVVGTRNNMEDVLVGDIGRDALDGLDAGNGVRIDHGDG
jgi:murein DD-endopeptidase MepM/ murein hydrolase activator NlpD